MRTMKQPLVRERRRVLCLGFVCALIPVWSHAEGLPQRNLLVEWRYTDAPMVGRPSGQYATQDAAPPAVVQSLLVLNGQEARLRLTRSVPITQWQFGVYADTASQSSSQQTTSGGWHAWSTTTWVDIGQGVVVQPRWTGGRQPVTLVVRAKDTRPGTDGPQGPIEQADMATTMRVPLGLWTPIARQAGVPTASPHPGSWSTGDAVEFQEPMRLEVRITAP